MTIVAIPPIVWGENLVGNGQPTLGYQTLDGANDYICWVHQLPRTGTLKSVGFRTDNVAVSDVLEARIETVDMTNGHATGTLYAANANGTLASVASNTSYWIALNGGNGVSVTAGDWVAIKIKFNSRVSGNLRVIHVWYGVGGGSIVPYRTYDAGSGNTKYNSSNNSNVALEYATLGVLPLCGAVPAVAATTKVWNSTSNPDRYGNRFSFPFGVRIHGVYFVPGSTSTNADVVLYDTDGATVLGTITCDKDLMGATGVVGRRYDFASPITLAANGVYRLAVVPSSSTNWQLYYADVTDNGAVRAMTAFPGAGEWYATSCNGAPANNASWTDIATRIFLMTPVLDGIDIPVPRPEIRGATL